ncbi:molybdate ABC transporter substrate-binding protein [Ruminiclostridium papyrosolvens]|uniref:Molybdate ABC transporter substrate-binding protein n=1 Tax=Ruminiclostridium papyrosolvens C7 TaxID=1330534 RepID=U4R2J0_9FIRM|nr:molybdate ABC transporter substrate-binding protein [Ruminiclostridium papyrosolvens]EPR11917.1 molybdate ABC transporter substrate-binding protein [Ruminiclostridium papyrosolvens C7]
MIRNKNILSYAISIFIMISIFTGCSIRNVNDTEEKDTNKVELLVSAAASLTETAKDLTGLYKKIKPNVDIKFSFGSSGALETQIEEGAPADIFISAALKQMDALEQEGLLLEGSKKELLVNKVLLISPQDRKIKLSRFQDAASDSVSRIALGEPDSVPAGQYAQEVFTALGIWNKVKGKAVFGSDVRQVLTWVENGDVDCGVVYQTDAIASKKINVVCEAPKDTHKPVIYPVAVIKNSKNQQEAGAFIDFLTTAQAADVFKKHGFEIK